MKRLIIFIDLSMSQQPRYREHLPEDWDLESTASLNSELRRLDDNIKTISGIISSEKELLCDLEPRPPSRLLTCIFSTCYFTLGKIFFCCSSLIREMHLTSHLYLDFWKLSEEVVINVEKLFWQGWWLVNGSEMSLHCCWRYKKPLTQLVNFIKEQIKQTSIFIYTEFFAILS